MLEAPPSRDTACEVRHPLDYIPVLDISTHSGVVPPSGLLPAPAASLYQVGRSTCCDCPHADTYEGWQCLDKRTTHETKSALLVTVEEEALLKT